MKISTLRERVTIEKNGAMMDAVGNHVNEWTEYFTCSASVASSTYQQKEQEKAGIIVSDDALVFVVRYCSELSGLDTTHYRVLFMGETYNISSIDRMNFEHKSLKISCTKDRRQNHVEQKSEH